jgi:hypothetical protein
VSYWSQSVSSYKADAIVCLPIGENYQSVGGRRLSCTGASLSATRIKGGWRNDFPSYIACVSTLFIHTPSEHCNELNLQFTLKTVTLIKIKWFRSKELLGIFEKLQSAFESLCLSVFLQNSKTTREILFKFYIQQFWKNCQAVSTFIQTGQF